MKQEIVAIQLMRALAALLVAFGHAQAEAVVMAARVGATFTPVAGAVTGAGVDLFFVISGFVMVYASRNLFAQPGGARAFLTRRIARVAPLYWAATMLFLVILVAAPNALNSAMPTWGEVFKSFLFIPYARPDSVWTQPVFKLGWTLEYEMFFYLVFAALIALPMRRAVFVLAIAFASLTAFGLLVPQPPGAVAFWLDPIILEFVAGAVVGACYFAGARVPKFVALAMMAVGSIALIATLPIIPEGPIGPMRVVIWGAPAALMIAAAALGRWRQPPGPMSRAGAMVGDASYALYLLHPFVLRACRLVWEQSGLERNAGPVAFIACFAFISVLVAVLVHRSFEIKVTRFVQVRLDTLMTNSRVLEGAA